MNNEVLNRYISYLKDQSRFILQEVKEEDFIHYLSDLVIYITNNLGFIIDKWLIRYEMKIKAYSDEEEIIIQKLSDQIIEIEERIDKAEDPSLKSKIIEKFKSDRDYTVYFSYQKELHDKLKDPFSAIDILINNRSTSYSHNSDNSRGYKISSILAFLHDALLDVKKEIEYNDQDIVRSKKLVHLQENWYKKKKYFEKINPMVQFYNLKQYCDFISPDFEEINWDRKDFFGRQLFYEKVTKIANFKEDGYQQPYSSKDKKEFTDEIKSLKYNLKITIHNLIVSLEEPLLIHQILLNFKHRTLLYNSDVYRKKFESEPQNGEKILTKIIAKYLFDNSMNAFTELSLGTNRIDMTTITDDVKLLVESKVINRNKSKKDIISDYTQLLSYADNYSQFFSIGRFILVYFRIKGNYLDLPQVLTLGQKIIYSLVIDISGEYPSDRTANLKKRRLTLSQKEIIKGIEDSD